MPEISPSRYLTTAGWDDVPHLTENAKRELLAATPPHLRDARSKGIPALGSGAIYPIAEDEITVSWRKMLDHWPRIYGLDVGWKRTAALWLAWDRDTDTVYAYQEHYQGGWQPVQHAVAIKARGDWIPGEIDPAAGGRSQLDGRALIAEYRTAGLKLHPAENAVEAGLHAVLDRLSTGRLKFVTDNCPNLLAEYRLYRRDAKGRVVKQHDHLMDALRYALMGLERAVTRPQQKIVQAQQIARAADSYAGY